MPRHASFLAFPMPTASWSVSVVTDLVHELAEGVRGARRVVAAKFKPGVIPGGAKREPGFHNPGLTERAPAPPKPREL